jgi:hypothetical protein
MPIHDCTRVKPGIFHDFHFSPDVSSALRVRLTKVTETCVVEQGSSGTLLLALLRTPPPYPRHGGRTEAAISPAQPNPVAGIVGWPMTRA